jgi:hypothetical protein
VPQSLRWRSLSWLFGVLALAACGDDGGGGAGGSSATGCFDYSGFAEGAPVSFRDEVVPVFEQSCGLTLGCHGDPSSPTDALGYRPYLASPAPGPSDPDLAIANIVGQASTQAEGMDLVAPGAPEKSYLMHKMDGTHDSCADVQCVDGDCKSVMPQNLEPIERASRDVVRRWILQGAESN